MDCSSPGSSVQGISQARILEWVAISFSRGSFQPKNWTCTSCIGRWILYPWSHQWRPNIIAVVLLLLSCFSHVRLCVTPLDGSPPGSPVPGILQARILEWVATAFSNAWEWKVKVKSLSRVRLFATPWTAAYQAPPYMRFSRHEYWSGLPLPSPNCCCIRP